VQDAASNNYVKRNYASRNILFSPTSALPSTPAGPCSSARWPPRRPSHPCRNDYAHDPPHIHRPHNRFLPTSRKKPRRAMPAWRQNHAIRRTARTERLLLVMRGRQIHLQSNRAKLPNRRQPRVAATSNSSAANTKRIRRRKAMPV
jgi:hypothetical protein